MAKDCHQPAVVRDCWPCHFSHGGLTPPSVGGGRFRLPCDVLKHTIGVRPDQARFASNAERLSMSERTHHLHDGQNVAINETDSDGGDQRGA